MTKELEDYYNALFELFATDGWKYLLEDWEETIEQLNKVSTVKDGRDLDYRQGALATLTGLVNLKYSCDQAYAQLQEAQ